MPDGVAFAGPDWDWNRVLTPRVVFLILPVVGLVIATYSNQLRAWEMTWRNNAAWGHGYLIPFIAVLIAHYRLKERTPRRATPCLGGVPLIMAGLVIRIWSRVMRFGYPGDATFLVVVAGVVLLLLGWEMFKALWVSVAYLVLMIPLDTRYYEGVALPLQTLAAAVSELVLRLLGMSVTREVNVLWLDSGPLAVVEACSGLRLLFAFVALGVMMAFIYRRPLWERVAIMASSIPIAVFCNVLRVTLMGISSNLLHFEAESVALGAPGWSAYAPRIGSWGQGAWIGLVLAGAAVIALVVRAWELPALARLLPQRKAAAFVLSWAVPLLGGLVLVLLNADITVGYSHPAQLEVVRQEVLDPESLPHQAFGFAMLGLAFVIMWAELRFIDMFFVEEADEDDASVPAAGAGAEPASSPPV